MATQLLKGFVQSPGSSSSPVMNPIDQVRTTQLTLDMFNNVLLNSSLSRNSAMHYNKSWTRYQDNTLVNDIIEAAQLVPSQVPNFSVPDVIKPIIISTMAMESGFNPLAIAGFVTADQIKAVQSDPEFYFNQMAGRAKGLVQFMNTSRAPVFRNTVHNFFHEPRFRRWKDFILDKTLKKVVFIRDPEFYSVLTQVGHPSEILPDMPYTQFYPTLHLLYETIDRITRTWDFNPTTGWAPRSVVPASHLEMLWAPAPAAKFDKQLGFIHLFNLHHIDGMPLSNKFRFHSSSFMKDYLMRLSLAAQLLRT